jgi:DNA helicase-2/ATP-dependent DNA helicase PcrA
MDKEFVKAYKELNEAQRKAVDLIDGPLLVVAGPGTGKTQLLSLRVANILKKTDADASSILCLTFTNFAAVNMRERLNKLIGSSAHNVNVRTFHSFAAEIMENYPDYFWQGARLSIVPDAVQLDIIQSLLAQLPLDNPLSAKFADNYTATNDVQKSLRLVKEAGLTPKKLASMININEAYIDQVETKLVDILGDKLSIKKLDDILSKVMALPDQSIEASVSPLISLSSVLKDSLSLAITKDKDIGKTTNTGKWKRQWLQTVDNKTAMFNEKKRNAWWLALSEVYDKYRQLLHSRGYYDYSDMIVEVITQLEQNPELLALVQEHYLYVLIDEFQDTNAAQLRLAHLVAAHYAQADKPNLMAVGDDDQSIFAFNGAELNNMLNFRKTYKSAQTIVLTDNYRSTQNVLNMAESIIEHAEDRLVLRSPDLTKSLKAKKVLDNGKLEHIIYPTKEHQLNLVAVSIKQVWQEDPTQSLAVLARTHSSLRQVSQALQREGVDIRYEQQNNILDYELINLISLIASAIVAISTGDNQTLNNCLSQVLAHKVWRIEPIALWRLATENQKSRNSWLETLKTSKDKSHNSIANWLLQLSSEASVQPLPVLMEYIIGLRQTKYFSSPIKDYFLSLKTIDNTYLDSLSGLNVLLGLINEFVASSGTSPKLADFVNFLRLNNSLGRQITDESWFVSNERAVQLLTIHKAKGLEFDSVFILDAVENEWQPKFMGRKPPANLPLQPYGENFDDYVRLAYVAATRSKRTIVITSFNHDSKNLPVLASPLFESFPKTIYKPKESQPNTNLAVLESNLAWPRLNTKNEKALLGPRLAEFRLSPTAFLQFIDIVYAGPDVFLQRQLLRLPELKTEFVAFGNAIHSALQHAQNLVNQGNYKLKSVLEAYDVSLEAQQQPLDVIDRFKPHGKAVINNLLGNLGYALPKGAEAELKINHLQLGEALLSGTLDHVYVNKGSLTISDYKTGSPLTSFETKAQNKAIKAWRHKNQLTFYCLLAKHDTRFKNVTNINAQMVYVEAESVKDLTLNLIPEEADILRLEKLIDKVWQKIINLDFPNTDKYSKDLIGIKQFEEDLLN